MTEEAAWSDRQATAEGAASVPRDPATDAMGGDAATLEAPSLHSTPTPPGTPPPPPGTPPPPPGYAGAEFPLRYNLVRPHNGRYLVGVCAALGRSTNTDPVLWRVLVAVLGFFGIGVLFYLAVWLFTPAEGDSVSPVEGLLGRGRSSTPPIVVIILGMLVAVVFGLVVSDGFRVALLGVVILMGGALLLRYSEGRRPAAGGAGPAPGSKFAMPPSYPGAAFAAAATGVPNPPPMPGPGSRAMPATPPTPPPPPPFPPGPFLPGAFPPPPAAPPGGYRPPFAPGGPYAGGGRPPGPPPVPVPPLPKPPKPPKERSGLGSATFSMMLVAIGVVTALDLSNAVRIDPSAYFAAPLVVVALGLFIGAWLGRARWLIALGLVLCMALGIAAAAESWDRVNNVGSNVVWRVDNLDDLATHYENNFGDTVLDISAVDFNGQRREILAEVSFGSLEVIVPPNLDVTANVDVSAGKATVFGSDWRGVNRPDASVTDLGPDGTGGGQLEITVRVSAGDVEVHR